MFRLSYKDRQKFRKSKFKQKKLKRLSKFWYNKLYIQRISWLAAHKLVSKKQRLVLKLLFSNK